MKNQNKNNSQVFKLTHLSVFQRQEYVIMRVEQSLTADTLLVESFEMLFYIRKG